MKKLIVGFAAVGAAIAWQRRVLPMMRDHCQQMATRCKEMMQDRSETTGHEATPQTMREHCEDMAARHREAAEPVVAA